MKWKKQPRRSAFRAILKTVEGKRIRVDVNEFSHFIRYTDDYTKEVKIFERSGQYDYRELGVAERVTRKEEIANAERRRS